LQRALCLDALSNVATLGAWLVPYLAVTGRGFGNDPGLAKHIAQFTLLRQRGADLGERLESAFRMLLRRHIYVVAVGTDSPELTLSHVRQAFHMLSSHEAVLGPCPDGGYYLLALRRGGPSERLKRLFRGIRWGTRWALRDSLRNITSVGLDCAFLETIADIDLPSDLAKLFRRMAKKPSIRRRAPNTWAFLTAELALYKPVPSGHARRTVAQTEQ
jgi:glycosyltransferase A (GT-A) superfamily protein (DUF2064 family)